MKEYYENFRVEDGVLYVRLSGEYPEERLQQKENIFQPLIDECTAHKCKKAIVDARKLQIHFGTMEMFQTGKDAAFLAFIGLRIALLAREDMIDPFFDDVAFNHGGNIGIFTDMEAARAWLQQ